MKLIVGLGNPGREYAATRHNAGFMVIDRLASEMGVPVKKKAFKAVVGQGQIAGEKAILAKPQTYMNLSGEAVGSLLRWYGLAAGDLILIYDDLDLPPGKLRIRPDGGSGGHKGVQSVVQSLGTDSFPRVRVGIGKPANPDYDSSDFVLGRLTGEEARCVEEALGLAAEAVRCMVREGLDKAMNLYNRK